MKNRNKFLHVIDSMALVPVPSHFISDIIKVELPLLKRFKFGNNRFSLPHKSLFEETNGYDGIELTLWGLFDENWKVNKKRIEIIKNSNIEIYTFHGCFEGCPKSLRGYYLNLAENNPDTFAAIRSQIDLVSELHKDKPILVFHPGYCGQNKDRSQALKNVINNIKPHVDYAADKNVIMTLENMDYRVEGEMIFHDYLDFEYLYNEINHPNLRITFDWGHMNTNSRNPDLIKRFGQDSVSKFEHVNEFIDKLNTKIIHAHVHYNKSHLPGQIKKKRNYINDFIYFIFFWTETVKFLNRGNVGISIYDKHLPFNRISNEYIESYKYSINRLLEKTSISEFDYITHEISPKKIFKYFNFIDEGAEYDDLMKSLKIFKSFMS